ncbi:MAG: hypothetical protein ACOCRK_02005 [bacterium]
MINVKDYLYFRNLYDLTKDPKVFRELGDNIYQLIENTPFFFEVFRHEDLIDEYLKEILEVLNFNGEKVWSKCNHECGKCHLYCEKAIDIMYLPYYKGYVRDKELLDKLINYFEKNMLIENCPNLAIYHLGEIPTPFVKLLSDYIIMNSLVETVAIWVGQVIEWFESSVEYKMIDKSIDTSISIMENDDNQDEYEKFIVDKDTPVDYSKYRLLPILTDEFYQTYKNLILDTIFEWLLDYKSRDFIMKFIADNFDSFLRSLKQMLKYYIDCKTNPEELLVDITERLRGGY